MDLDKLKEWVQAEINASIESREVGADGYYGGCKEERIRADKLFEELKKGTA